MRKLVYKISLIVIAIIGSIIIGTILYKQFQKLFSKPYTYIIHGDKDNMYGRIESLNKSLDSLEFYNLMNNLIDTSNKDLLSVEMAMRYASENKICQFLGKIEQENNYLRNLPVDTVWKVKIRNNYFRESGIKDATIMMNIPKYLKSLKEHCGIDE